MRRRLISLRESMGLTQEQFAKAIGMKRSAYSMIETGDRGIKFATVLKIKKFTGVSDDSIFFNYK